jgi:DNA-binding NarL/FixJ family response regulator
MNGVHGDDHAPADGQARLTPRQEQVIRLATGGMPAKEIARRLGISKRTVEDHFTAACERFGAANRTELITRALQTGIAMPIAAPVGEEVRSCSETTRFPNIPAARMPNQADTRVLDLGPVHDERRRGRPTVMTHERLAAARELLTAYTVTQVARKLGVSRTTLYAHLDAIARTG